MLLRIYLTHFYVSKEVQPEVLGSNPCHARRTNRSEFSVVFREHHLACVNVD